MLSADTSQEASGMRFEIRVGGQWSSAVAERFADVTATEEPSCMVLSADLDQAALHGLLERIRALDLELIDVRRTRPTRRRDPA